MGLSRHANSSVNGLLGLSHSLVKWKDVSHLPIDLCHSRNLPRVCTRLLKKSSKAMLNPISGPISVVHACLGHCPRAIFVGMFTHLPVNQYIFSLLSPYIFTSPN
ncbi:hypothetical protein I3842_10G000800 [Carya illinoinensis]|uniref:Uncharacterized protein n=1 Tax=Carya illinoinensis TaxID=32201 RepID=A0A922DTS8_CARIL|nr:hypothetical protein I3842_10G000800 [Carya illinoinensis]